ncbi:unnamed protein product, partial [Mesorhabditis belari]|uniref:Uncharacterized protein n=1 Tax=Mesorhabditis belari TaxID=2138241 RepID=A0AAF3E858_9BILA
FGSVGVFFGVSGLFVVRKNLILKGIIEHYAFVDLANFITINACHVIWGIPSAIWHVNEAIPWLDYTISGAAFTAISLGFPPKVC